MEVLDDKIKAFLDVGDGNGNGDGNGYGKGIKQFNGMNVYTIDDTPTIITNVKGRIASGYTVRHNTELVPCFVARVGNYFGHGDTAHSAFDAANAKYEENRPLSDRIDDFVKEFPTLQTEAKCSEFYKWHHILTGSCEFGRNEFRERHGISLDEVHTVEWFLELVKDAYGKDVIKQVRERY